MRLVTFSLAVVATFACAAVAGAAVKPEAAINYRQSAYHLIGWNFSPLGAMVKGKKPFDATAFTLHADRIAYLSDQVVEGFPKGSDKGAHTDAKAALWTNFDDFSEKAKAFNTEAKALAEVAKSKDEAKSKAQFKKVAEACKACHEKYKND
jgi:cytochrome c556